MAKHSESDIEKVVQWSKDVSRTWSEMVKAGREPSLEEVAQALAGRRGQAVEEVAGVLSGIEVFMTYAEREPGPEETALEEEQAGLAAAQAAVRPLVQLRLQRRLDVGDEQVQEVRCQGCGQKMEGQGRRQRTWRVSLRRGPLERIDQRQDKTD